MFDRNDRHAEEVSKEIKESGGDWLEYIFNHPLQSLLFGAVISLALKSLICKKTM